MKTIEYLTAVVLARRSLHLPLGEEAVLWADLLLLQDTEFPEVKHLAQHDSQATQAQIESQVDVILSKLGLELADEKPAHLLLIWAETQKLLKSEMNGDQFLEHMRMLCEKFDHEPVYMQFYLLHCAGKDLSKGASSIVFHDREVDGNNFEQVLRWEIDLFLEQNEDQILGLIKIEK